MAILEELQQAIIEGNAPLAKSLTEVALKAGSSPAILMQQALIPSMAVVGERMRNQEYYVPEVLVAARAMHWSLGVLRPLLVAGGVRPEGKVVFATVRGDLHDIGKNLVIMLLEGAGYQIVDLGTDVAPDRIVAAVREHRPDLLGMSSLLTTTMPSMQSTMEALERAGLRRSVKVIVGGAPVTARYASEIGADGFAPDAAAAVDLARRLLTA